MTTTEEHNLGYPHDARQCESPECALFLERVMADPGKRALLESDRLFGYHYTPDNPNAEYRELPR